MLAKQTISVQVNKSRPGKYMGMTLYYCGLVAIVAIFMLPFIIMLSTSLKSNIEVYAWPPTLIPKDFQWQNYRLPFDEYDFLLYFKNSMIVAGLRVVGILVFNSLVAYAFARLEWPGRKIWFGLLMITMALPQEVTLIPLFKLFGGIGLLGTFWPLIIRRWIGSPFLIFLMRQFFKGIPNELSEAARIDGANEFQIYARIVLPLSLPVMATAIIYEFSWAWNDFMEPLVYLKDKDLWTLPQGLYSMASETIVDWGALMAASVMTLIPVAVIFLALQRYFIESSAVSGIKS